jgi:hypothetical protein
MALRLFQIVDTSDCSRTPASEPPYFSDKKVAKEARKRLNKEHESETRFIVSPGPDHHNYKG